MSDNSSESEKRPGWRYFIFPGIALVFLIVLFSMKGRLTAYLSESIQDQVDPITIAGVNNYVDSLFNYNQNKGLYQITFLEFGALNCSACKRMEAVMEEIRVSYSGIVNVVFINTMLRDNLAMTKAFGIVVIPTQVLLDRDGKEFYRHQGYISASDLQKNFDRRPE